jgi:hypothetical protein
MKKMTGRCLCGTIKISYNGKPGPAGYCHCDDCRRCTGSAFNVSVRVDRDKLVIKNEDKLGTYSYIADSGNKMSRLFCKQCGSPIMTLHAVMPGYAWIKAGIIDQTEAIKPKGESWKSRKVPWADIKVETSYAKGTGKKGDKK